MGGPGGSGSVGGSQGGTSDGIGKVLDEFSQLDPKKIMLKRDENGKLSVLSKATTNFFTRHRDKSFYNLEDNIELLKNKIKTIAANIPSNKKNDIEPTTKKYDELITALAHRKLKRKWYEFFVSEDKITNRINDFIKNNSAKSLKLEFKEVPPTTETTSSPPTLQQTKVTVVAGEVPPTLERNDTPPETGTPHSPPSPAVQIAAIQGNLPTEQRGGVGARMPAGTPPPLDASPTSPTSIAQPKTITSEKDAKGASELFGSPSASALSPAGVFDTTSTDQEMQPDHFISEGEVFSPASSSQLKSDFGSIDLMELQGNWRAADSDFNIIRNNFAKLEIAGAAVPETLLSARGVLGDNINAVENNEEWREKFAHFSKELTAARTSYDKLVRLENTWKKAQTNFAEITKKFASLEVGMGVPDTLKQAHDALRDISKVENTTEWQAKFDRFSKELAAAKSSYVTQALAPHRRILEETKKKLEALYAILVKKGTKLNLNLANYQVKMFTDYLDRIKNVESECEKIQNNPTQTQTLDAINEQLEKIKKDTALLGETYDGRLRWVRGLIEAKRNRIQDTYERAKDEFRRYEGDFEVSIPKIDESLPVTSMEKFIDSLQSAEDTVKSNINYVDDLDVQYTAYIEDIDKLESAIKSGLTRSSSEDDSSSERSKLSGPEIQYLEGLQKLCKVTRQMVTDFIPRPGMNPPSHIAGIPFSNFGRGLNIALAGIRRMQLEDASQAKLKSALDSLHFELGEESRTESERYKNLEAIRKKALRTLEDIYSDCPPVPKTVQTAAIPTIDKIDEQLRNFDEMITQCNEEISTTNIYKATVLRFGKSKLEQEKNNFLYHVNLYHELPSKAFDPAHFAITKDNFKEMLPAFSKSDTDHPELDEIVNMLTAIKNKHPDIVPEPQSLFEPLFKSSDKDPISIDNEELSDLHAQVTILYDQLFRKTTEETES